MKRLNDFLGRFFPPAQPIPSGVYQYQSNGENEQPLYRLHLRMESDGTGILLINASTVLHLNQTAAEIAYLIIQRKSDTEAADEIVNRYHVSHDQAENDIKDLRERIRTLISTPDLDPVTFLDLDRMTPYSQQISAPYRMDCALTYRTSDGDKTQAPVDRVRRELLTSEWQQILDKAWNAGIPHVIFTGGEPTLRDDLCDLVAYAEKLGMVSGVLTDGLRLTDRHYMHLLLNSGLDHLMILLDPDYEQSWEAVRDAIGEDIFTTVHVTVTQQNKDHASELLERLAKIGVTSLSISTDTPELRDQVMELSNVAAALKLTLVMDLPVPYSAFHPVAIELEQTGEYPKGAGKAWIYVEPDGDVTPTQGDPKVLGNLLVDPWEIIWQNR